MIAVNYFKSKTMKGVEAGIKEIGLIVSQISKDMADCKAIDLSKLEKMGQSFASPATFAYHVGKDLMVNGKQIYSEIDDSIKQWDASNYFGFGHDLGEALSKMIIGQE